jgi:hypothetical protein
VQESKGSEGFSERNGGVTVRWIDRVARGVSGCGEQVDNLLDGFVSTVVGEFEAALGPVLGIRPMVETAVGEGAA